MHRIDTSTAQVDKFGAGKNGFSAGNPQTGTPATDLDEAFFDMLQEELAAVVESSGATLDKTKHNQLLTALKALLLSRATPFADIKADGTTATALANLGAAPLMSPAFTGTPTSTTAATGTNTTQIATTAFVQSSLTGLIGAIRNARMSVPTAGATATFTADEIIVADSLSGRQFRLTSFSNTINLATTGANGMDTGTVPAAGYVALYAIYNPTTSTSALLAVDATSAVAPEIYAGTHLPSGYTASALVSVWRTSSSLFVIGYQRERHIAIVTTVVYSTTTAVTSYNALSLSAAVPINGKSADMQIVCSQTTPNSAIELSIAESPVGIGGFTANASAFSSGSSGSPTTTSTSYASSVLDIIDTQALYYKMSTSTAATYVISCRGYSI